MLACMIMINVISCLKSKSEIESIQWDYNNTTISQFSIQMNIEEKHWDKWIQFIKNNSLEAKGRTFKDHLKTAILDSIKFKKNVSTDKYDSVVDIANIYFAYSNKEVIELM